LAHRFVNKFNQNFVLAFFKIGELVLIKRPLFLGKFHRKPTYLAKDIDPPDFLLIQKQKNASENILNFN